MFSAEAFGISDGFQTSSISRHQVEEILCRVHTGSNADVRYLHRFGQEIAYVYVYLQP